ncbi:transporter, YbiR family [Lachnospiraceae bacterium A10]|nr:transporter, YbiR family [Lachnospiraceae bacterium A10]
MSKIVNFLKQETVLSIAAILAIVSAIVIKPDQQYLNYIDFRTLAILFCLMAIMNGFQKIGVFDFAARGLIKRAGNVTALMLLLVLLCFFSSMLITNDVALITFVPLTIITFEKMYPESAAKKNRQHEKQTVFVIGTVIMQTMAANLGSMLTPLGNPQNLYLYGISGMGFRQFLMLMLPYSAASLVLITVAVLLFKLYRNERCEAAITVDDSFLWNRERKILCACYGLLFLLSLLTVLHVLSYPVLFAIVLVSLLVLDYLFGRNVIRTTDLSLIFTFIFLFVFIGNMGRVGVFRDFLESFIEGREVISAVIASQVMSNVPAAILLSGFTEDVNALVIGTNLGGLGTLIASMASLISFKYIARWNKKMRGKYFLGFTVMNLIFLAFLLVLYHLL